MFDFNSIGYISLQNHRFLQSPPIPKTKTKERSILTDIYHDTEDIFRSNIFPSKSPHLFHSPPVPKTRTKETKRSCENLL